MRTVMQKGAARVLALFLCLTMLLGMVPASMAAGTEATDADTQSRIVHLDMGRKYFTPDWIKSLIDKMAKLGYNQLELDFGNSEEGQLRFALNNMTVEYTYEESVPVTEAEEPADATEQPADTTEQPTDATEQPADATEQPADATEESTDEVQALVEEVALQNETVGVTGNTYMETSYRSVEKSGAVDLSSALPANGEYLDETDMAGIIDYADEKGIEIVPLLNSPGHFGAVLDGVKDAEGNPVDFSYNGSNSLDITNGEAVAFGQAVVLKYAQWFYEQGCRTFNIGADEFYNEGGSFSSLTPNQYDLFADYVNDLYDGLKEIGYTTIRAFNDGFYYGGRTDVTFREFEVCYWTSGWSGYDVASADTIQRMGHSLINTHGDYYYVSGGSSPMTDGTLAANSFDVEQFMGGTIDNPAGAMFCIWCDDPNAETEGQIWANLFEDPAYLLNYTTGLKGAVTKTDENTGVTVTANGLTDLTVTEATLNNSSYSAYVAYEMTPVTDAGTYTGEAEVTIPLGNLKDYNANRLTGFVVNNDGSVQTVSGTKNNDGTYTFTMPHFSVGGVALVEATYDMPDTYKGSVEQKTATGETYYEKVSGANAITAGTQYLIVGAYSSYYGASYYAMTASGDAQQVSPSNNRIDGSYDSNLWTFESAGGGYYLKDSNGRYAYPNASRSWGSWSYSLSTNENNGQAVTVSGSDTVTISRSVSSNNRNTTSYLALSTKWWGEVEGFDGSEDSSNLTLYKKVTVPGGTYYTVGTAGMNALLSAVPSTNGGVYTDASWAPFQEALQAAQTALGNVKDSYETQQAAELDQDALNTAAEALYDAWQALEEDPNYVPEPDWTPTFKYFVANAHDVSNIPNGTHDGGSDHAQNSKAAVATTSGMAVSEMVDSVVYTQRENRSIFWRAYVQSSTKQTQGGQDLTDEGQNIGTQAMALRYVDTWYYQDTDGTWHELEQTDQLTAYYVEETTVSDEVTVYLSDWGSNPYDSSNDPVWNWSNGFISLSFQTVYVDTGFVSPEDLKSTTQFTGNGTQYSVIEILNSSEYEVVDVTLLSGKFTGDSASSFTLPNFPEPDLDTEKSIYNSDGSVQPIPKVNNNGTAWLVRIYVKPVEKENTLTIKYVDETSGSDVEIYTGSINAYGDLTYKDAVTNNGQTFGSLSADDLRAMTADAMDASYILSPTGDGTGSVKQYFNTDLSVIPAIDAKYKSGIYSYTGAAISDEGRTLTFYYKASSAITASYVVDFGLPVSIPVSDLVSNPDEVVSVTVVNGRYGEASATRSAITYTPTSILRGTDSIQVTISYGTSSVTAMVYLYPATTVYYEAEDFVSTKGAWSEAGTSGNRTQAATKLGEETNNYGYDAAYDDNANGWSNGNADKVTVSAATYSSNGAWPTASFTFNGTGVDIISQTDTRAGIILVDVKQGTKAIKQYIVNNYYGYTYNSTDGTWTTSEDNGNGIVNSIYQVPVIAVRDLDYGTYSVTITVAYDSLFDVANKGSFDFYLDAIRVYNTLENSSVYATDGEANPIFVPVHERVTDFGTTGTLVDGLWNADKGLFDVVGPNNEVYLAPGQSVTLTMEEDETGRAQLAARIISGASPATLKIDNETVTVKSTVDMYYELDDNVNNTVTITNQSTTSTIALTMFKFFGGAR